jgi:hypothetical protein
MSTLILINASDGKLSNSPTNTRQPRFRNDGGIGDDKLTFARALGCGRQDGDVFSNLHREIDRVFEDFTHGAQLPWAAGNGKMRHGWSFPRRNCVVREFRLTAELPGVEEGEIDISLSADMLASRPRRSSLAICLRYRACCFRWSAAQRSWRHVRRDQHQMAERRSRGAGGG